MRNRLTIFVVVAALLGLFAVALPAQAQGSVWTGQYYNNSFLADPIAVTQQDANIAFNWGLGSPAAGVGVDNFSVRWATDVSLQPGVYRFFALADDNIRVTFNYNQTIIDTFNTTQMGQTLSGDVQVTQAGVYHIQVDYREVTGDAYAYVTYANAATNPQPNFNVPTSGPSLTGSWTSQYFANPSLSGSPAAILSESSPNHNWGTGQPVPAVPADQWSARFTSVQTLNPGTYTASFNVDDGFRFYVNGVLLLDRYSTAVGLIHTTSFTVSGGPNTFQIDYVEYGGNGFLGFTLAQGTGTAPQPTTAPQQPPTATYGNITVTAFRLNVRTEPSATASVITRINRFEQYPITGRSADGRWFQIYITNQFGWVSGGWVNVPNASAVPVVGGGQTVQPPANTGLVVTATPYSVVIRSGPGTQFGRLATMPAGATAQVLGRNANATWWQISYNGITGWSSAEFARLQAGADPNTIAVTG